ncbi:MAG: cyanophycin synthetase [Oscillospiraceae bacterium]|nr:cyanophycin synthetase [Oscillospiraceae bacterium]
METDKIVICDDTVYSGRNIYSHKPVIKMIVDIGCYGNIPTKDISGFHTRLLEAFPGLKTNCCGLGYEGGFLERLNEGTYLAHVLEHVILELQAMLGYDVTYGKTRVIKEPSVYYLVYRYQNEVCGLECGKAAVFILNSFLRGVDVCLEEFIDYLKRASAEAELGPSTSAIVKEARVRGLPVTRIGHESMVRLGYGAFSRVIESTLTDATSCIAADISCNKQLTKALLSEQHIPVPYGRTVYSELSAVVAAEELGYPVVIKPSDGNQGKGVFLNLTGPEEIRNAYAEAAPHGKGVIVERFIQGNDYRVLVVGGRVSAVARRLPAMVIGDGTNTVRQLVELVNEDETRGERHEKPLTKIKLDGVAERILDRQGLTAESVPERGEAVVLRANGNLSTGGTAVDETQRIHPENAALAVLAAKVIGVDVAGIDFVAEDISRSIRETGGAIVEVNASPGIRMHLYPSQGAPRNVARDIVRNLFPTEESCRFPLVSVTGTNGKTTTARLIAHGLMAAGRRVGLTCTSGTFINENCVFEGDHSGPRSARALLGSREIDCAVLETARGGILREGLGYDLADVGMVLNIAEDHLDMDGAKTLEDLAFVKSLVTEAVKENGYAVFNAEDAMLPYLMKRTKARVILFSRNNCFAQAGCERVDIRVFQQDGSIKIQEGSTVSPVAAVADIPITRRGKIECNIENAIAAAAALYGLGLPVDVIGRGLTSFRNNTGRFQLYRVGNFRVMLDYGHNLPGYREVIQACGALGHTRLVGIVGMPGDRGDAAIRAVGDLCAKAFDQIYVKEDRDRRGRARLEVASLFYEEIRSHGVEENRVQIIEDELDALKAAVRSAEAGDLIVVLYETLEPLTEYLHVITGMAEPTPQRQDGIAAYHMDGKGNVI